MNARGEGGGREMIWSLPSGNRKRERGREKGERKKREYFAMREETKISGGNTSVLRIGTGSFANGSKRRLSTTLAKIVPDHLAKPANARMNREDGRERGREKREEKSRKEDGGGRLRLVVTRKRKTRSIGRPSIDDPT